MSKTSKVLVGVAVGLLAVGVIAAPASATALTSAQVSAIISLLQSFGADSATITNVQASLTGGTPSATPAATAFTRNLTVGATGADVTALQNFLVAKGFLVLPAGVKTGYFGSLTKSALAAYQAANGITPASGYFGPLTMASVKAMMGTTGGTTTGGTTTGGTTTGGTTGITTLGAQGTIAVDLNPSPSSNTPIYANDSKDPVIGLRIKAFNSDLAVQRVTLDLGTATGIFNKIFNHLYVMDGSTVLADVPFNINTVYKSGTTYYIQLTGFNFIVPMGQTKVLTIAADVYPSINTGSTSGSCNDAAGSDTCTFTIDVNAVRAVDGAGVDVTGPSTAFSNAAAVNAALVDNATLTVSLSANTPAAKQIVATDGASRNEAWDKELAKFNLKATGDKVQVTDWTVGIETVNSANPGTVSVVNLYDDATGALIGSAATSGKIATFSNINTWIPKDTTRTFSLRVKVTGVNNAGIETFGASTTGSTEVTALNSQGSTVTPSGTASTSAVLSLINQGLEISLSGAPTISTNGVPQSATTNTYSTSTLSAIFNVNLRAVDAAVLLGNTSSGTPAFASSSTGFKLYVNGSASTAYASAATTTSYSQPSGYTLTTNTFTLNDGDNFTIPVNYSIVGRTAASAGLMAQGTQVAVGMEGVQWTSAGGAYTSSFMAGLTDWRTPSVTFP